MLRLQVAFGSSALLALGFVVSTEGCSASSDVADTTASATTGVGGAGGAGDVASSASSASAGGAGGEGGEGGSPPSCAPYDGVLLAIDEIFLGANGFDGTAASDAWKEFGFDIDGQATAADTSKHCLPAQGGSAGDFVDGPMGRDNSFGRNVLPAVNALVPPLDKQANDAIATGQFTQIFAFEGLGSEADVPSLVTRVYGGAPLGKAPAWKGSDCWPVLHETLTDPKDVASAKTTFATAKLVNNRWDSNGEQVFDLTLNVAGLALPITIHRARMSVQLAPTHQGGALGQIGGLVKTEEFVSRLRIVAGFLGSTACDVFDSTLANQIRRASDLLEDGTQDPTKTCNAISVGIGFSLRQVGLGTVAPAATPVEDKCP